MEKIETAAEQARVRQFTRNKWFFSVSGIGRDMSYTLVATFLLTYLQFGVSMSIAQFTTLAVLVGVVGRVWDAVNDPLMGSIIENTHFRWGKFKPWIFSGAILSGIFILLMFNVRFTGWGFVVFIIAMYLLWETSFTMNDIGYWSMLPSVTSKKDERDRLSMLTLAFAAVGAVLTNAVFSLFSAGNVVSTYRTWSVVIVLVFIGSQTMASFCCREAHRTEKKSDAGVSLKQILKVLRRNTQALWMGLALLLHYISNGLLVTLAYNLYYLEVGYDGNVFYFVAVYGIASVAANLFYPGLARRMSRKKILTLSAVLAFVGYTAIFLTGWVSWFPFDLVTFSVFGLMTFAGQTGFYMATVINYTNCVEYNEYITGERNEAIISTLRPFVAKLSDAVKYIVQILVLVASGIYLLSQNISAMETQKNFVASMESPREQTAYFVTVRDYLARYEAGAPESELQTELDTDALLSRFQISAKNLSAIGDCHVIRSEYSEGKQIGSAVDLGRLSELSESQLLSDSSFVYTLQISGTDAEGNEYNAGNRNFRDVTAVSSRVILRFAACILPILFLAAALWIERKKYFIDEEYYENILNELASRASSSATSVSQTDTAHSSGENSSVTHGS